MNSHRKSIWIFYLLASTGFILLSLYCMYTWRSGAWLREDSIDIPKFLIVSSLLIGAFLAALAFSDLISRSEAASEIHPGVALALGLILVLASWAMPGNLETPLRANLSKCRTVMMEMAEKISDSVKQTGEVPANLELLFTEGEMADPFAPDRGRFLWRKTSAKTGMISSVGPNQINDFELTGEIIPYNVTNGSFSIGDLVSPVP